MEFPVAIRIFGSSVLLHVIFEFLAFFIGFRYYLFLRKKAGDRISAESRMWIITGAIFGALIGSRLVGGFENWPALQNAPNTFFYFYTNKTVLGGLFGGTLGVELIKKLIGEKQKSGDLFVFPILLAIIVGRIGCFTMGIYEETYGLPTNMPFGMNLGDGIARHPVALYEIFFLMLLWCALWFIKNKYKLQPGGLFKIMMIAYFLFRFMLDYIKPKYDYFFGLSAIQITSLLGLLYYFKYILHPKKLIKNYA